ncbi:glycosyltransferase [Candidatus Pelagibacter sp.]|nr:glycosyltransferase [Candidatus Pelagibacter sp.]
MLHKKKILVFTATYNEADNIEKLILDLFHSNKKIHVLVVDDNSPDGTGSKIIKLKKKFKKLFLYSRKKKLGLDTAHKYAYNFALKKKYDYLITMDADLSHNPKKINSFIKYLSKYSFVIGSRYMKKGKCLMKGKRLILSKYGNLIIKKILKIHLTEFTTSYRGFNIKKLKNFSLNLVKTNGYSFFMGTVFEIYKRDFDIKEIPIIFKDRSHGVSKIPKLEIIRTLKNLLILYFKK